MSMKAAMFNVNSEEKSNTGNNILFSSINITKAWCATENHTDYP